MTDILEKYPEVKAVREQMLEDGASFNANHNIAEYMTPEVMEQMHDAVEEACANVLNALLINLDTDHNSQDTPRRLAKMFLKETMYGRYQPRPNITEFPNASNLDQMLIVRNLRVESLCSHHHQNIRGHAHIAVMPKRDGKVVGLSKFSRILDWICRRPQIQEEMTTQIADEIQEVLDDNSILGVAVVIVADHQCMSCRGVMEQDSDTVTSVMRGCFRDEQSYKQEFMSSIAKHL